MVRHLIIFIHQVEVWAVLVFSSRKNSCSDEWWTCDVADWKVWLWRDLLWLTLLSWTRCRGWSFSILMILSPISQSVYVGAICPCVSYRLFYLLYTLQVKKVGHWLNDFFCHNFYRCWPIFFQFFHGTLSGKLCGVVRFVMVTLLQVFSWVHQWKNFDNISLSGKVMRKTQCPSFGLAVHNAICISVVILTVWCCRLSSRNDM